MAIFYVRGGNMLPSFKLPSLPTHIKVDMFFDRKAVKDALTAMEYRGLTKASLLVRRNAQKSIQKQGMAKPVLKVMKTYPGMNLSQIAKLQLASAERQGVQRDSRGRYLKGSGAVRSINGQITAKDRQAAIDRIREIKRRPPSPAGSPPHTHVPFGHMLGFRRNLYNAYDKMTHSAVVGPSKKGKNWTIPSLHEYGGSRTLTAWAWRPQRPSRMRRPIITWVVSGENPGPNWMPTGTSKRVGYPARPFLGPALTKSRPRFAEFFRDAFAAGSRGG